MYAYVERQQGQCICTGVKAQRSMDGVVETSNNNINNKGFKIMKQKQNVTRPL